MVVWVRLPFQFHVILYSTMNTETLIVSYMIPVSIHPSPVSNRQIWLYVSIVTALPSIPLYPLIDMVVPRGAQLEGSRASIGTAGHNECGQYQIYKFHEIIFFTVNLDKLLEGHWDIPYINPLTAGNVSVCNHHCGYWCPGAKAPGHRYPQCWLNIHCIGLIPCRIATFIVNNNRK